MKIALLWSLTLVALATRGASGPLELKLSAARIEYVVDRGGKSIEEYAALLKEKPWSHAAPPVVLSVEVKNVSDHEVTLFGVPRPMLVLKGPREESVIEVFKDHFYVTPSRKVILGPGKTTTLHSIQWFGAITQTDHAVIADLAYPVGAATKSVHWTEAGEYTLRAVLTMGMSPAPLGAAPFNTREFHSSETLAGMAQVIVESEPVTLKVREGNLGDYWLAALKDTNADVRLVAVNTLQALTPSMPVREAVAQRLIDPDVRVRRAAAQAIEAVSHSLLQNKAESEAVTASLFAALKDEDAGVRIASLMALVEASTFSKDTVSMVLPLLRDADKSVRMTAAGIPGALSIRQRKVEASAIPALLDRMTNDIEVRTAAVTSLGHMHSVEAIPAVVQMISGTDGNARNAAIVAAGNIGPAAVAAVPLLFEATKDDDVRMSAIYALKNIGCEGPAALKFLVPALKAEPDGYARVDIIRALSHLSGAASIPALIAVVQKDPHAAARQYAATELGTLKSAAAVMPIAKLLKETTASVRDSAANALGEIGKDAKVAMPMLLVTLRTDKEAQTRWLAARSISQIGAEKDAVPMLIEALGDSDVNIQFYCATTLANIGPDARSAIPKLTELLTQADGNVRKHSEEALKKIQQTDR